MNKFNYASMLLYSQVIQLGLNNPRINFIRKNSFAILYAMSEQLQTSHISCDPDMHFKMRNTSEAIRQGIESADHYIINDIDAEEARIVADIECMGEMQTGDGRTAIITMLSFMAVYMEYLRQDEHPTIGGQELLANMTAVKTSIETMDDEQLAYMTESVTIAIGADFCFEPHMNELVELLRTMMELAS